MVEWLNIISSLKLIFYMNVQEYKPAVSAYQHLDLCNQSADKLHCAVVVGYAAASHCYELAADLCYL
jgi:hypothetical protein